MPFNMKDLKRLKQHENNARFRADADAPKNFGYPMTEVSGDSAHVYIYDVIGWPFIEAQDVINAIPSGISEIVVHINSPGGSVFEGLAIYNWLKGHSAKVNVVVDSLAASIASVIAMAGESREMAKSAFYMIHDPWLAMSGSAEDLRKEADLLEKIEETLAQVYSDRTGANVETVRQWMHDETWFNGTDARQNGFATAITDGEPAQQNISKFDLSAFFSAPTLMRAAASARSDKSAEPQHRENKQMNEQLRKMLEAKGLAKDATEEQAIAFLHDVLTGTTEQEIDAEEVKKIQTEAAKAEKERAKAIRRDVARAGLKPEFADTLIDGNTPLDAAREKIFAEMERVNPPVGAGRLEVGTTEGEKFRAAAVDGLLMRSGKRVEKPAAGAEQFRGYEMTAIIRESLSRAGVNVQHLNSRRAVADFVFGGPQGMMSTSDFPNIFRDAANKTLLKAYQEYPATWRPWVNVVPANDFKDIYGTSLSEAPSLDLVNENGEYKAGNLSDAQESYRMFKYGKIIYLSWEMLINDDLRAFSRIPQLLGNAARRKESDLVYSLLQSNSLAGPTMNDGNSLFDATNHSNFVESGSGAVVSVSTLEAGRTAMRKQTGAKGAHLDLRPRYLVVPVAQETSAEVILRSRGSVDDNKNSGVVNPWFNSLDPISDPRLDDVSANAWYLIADPAQADTFEVAYLDGQEQPELSENEEFTRDAMGWKIRHVFGVGAMDWRSFYCNYGE